MGLSFHASLASIVHLCGSFVLHTATVWLFLMAHWSDEDWH